MKRFGIVGWKNSGKTGLMERLVAELTGRGLRISTLKHAHHAFDVDQPGRDSHRHRVAGAKQVLIAGGARWALMTELRGADEPGLETLIAKLSPVDLVLIEGWKSATHPKISCHRQETGRAAYLDDTVVAVASDAQQDWAVPTLDLNDTQSLADLVLHHATAP